MSAAPAGRLHYPVQDVRNRRLRRAAPRLRGRHGRAAPDGVPRLRLVGYRPGRRRRRTHRRRRAGRLANLEERAGRNGPGSRWPAAPAWAIPAGPPTAAPPTATRTRTATPPARSPSSTTASSRTSRSCATSWRRPASSSPATPTPRSPCTWWRRHIATARPPAISPASVLAVLRRLEGHFTLVFANADEPGTIVAARRSTPLVLGVGDGEMFVGSDVAAFIEHTRRRRRTRPGPGRGDHRRRLPDHRLRRQRPDARVPRVSHRLGPGRRREGRLRVLHAQGDRRAAHRGGRYAARPFRRRPDRARRAAAVRPGTARHRQGLRGRLRHGLPLRAARQVRDRALDAAAGGSGARQRIPLPRPGTGPQHAGGGHLPVRRDRRHPGSGPARQGAEGQGAGDLQHQRLADPPRVRRGALHPRRPGDRRRLDQDLPGPGGRQLPARSGAGAGARHQVPRRGRARVPRAGSDAGPGGPGARRDRAGGRAGPPVRPVDRPCCSSAATSATRWRWKAR